MEHLIPQAWFTGLHPVVLLVLTLVSMAFLIKGADALIEGASGLAYRLGLPKVIIGATVVSLGTTSPECAVSVMAALGGDGGLALGNAVGSIIADTCLIFGVCCLLVALPVDRYVLSRQGWVQFGSAILLALVCYGTFLASGDEAEIGRGVGALFLALLAGYLLLSIRWATRHESPLASESVPAVEERSALRMLGEILVGLLVVILSSRVLICTVIEIATLLEVPQVVISATLVAFGTSVPELAVGLRSISKRHPEILVGNVIGADVLNVLFVAGAAAFAAPLPIIDPAANEPRIFLYVHVPTMVLALVMFRLFIARAVRRGSFERWQGAPLVGIYVLYVTIQFVIEGGSG